MSGGPAILVVGGYGVVGRRITALLAPRFPERVLIAGRDEQKASSLANQIGNGARALRMDIDDPASVEVGIKEAGTVVVCVAQRELHLLRAAVAHGLAYTDLAPRLAFWKGVKTLDAEARRTGARILLGAGLSPGISNMMACKLARTLGGIDSIETSILLSLGDEYGPDSLNHVFESVTQSFTVVERNSSRQAWPFSEGVRVRFPGFASAKMAYVFPWSDVVYFPKTLGAQTAIGRFAIEPAWLGQAVSLLLRAGGRTWLADPGSSHTRRRVLERLKRRYASHNRFGLVVTARRNRRTLTMSLAGRQQAEATAAGAAELARGLAAGESREPGVWFPEQVVSPDVFLETLAGLGWTATTEELPTRTATAGTCEHGSVTP